jgi:hypothetical protein
MYPIFEKRLGQEYAGSMVAHMVYGSRAMRQNDITHWRTAL